MTQLKNIKYWKKHVKHLSRNACETVKDVTHMFFNTKDYNDKFLKENGEPTTDEYAEIMRKHDLKTEKANGYYFGNVADISKNVNER